MIDCGRKHAALRSDGHAEGSCVVLAALPVCAEQCRRVLVEGDAALLVSLRGFLPRPFAVLRDAAPDHENSLIQIDQIPPQRAQLAAPGTGRHGEPYQNTPRDISECGVENRGRLFGGGRVRVMGGGPWWLRLFQR